MKKNSMVPAIACLVCLFAGYNANAQPAAVIKKEIEKTNILYFNFFQKKNLAIVGLYTDDACLLPPNAPAICGKAALDKDFKDAYAGGQIAGVKFSTIDIYGDGVLYITEEGNWQVFNNNNQVIDTGKYLKLWKKTPQGWKIYRDIFNSNKKG